MDKRVWARRTDSTINTGARLPLAIVERLEEYCRTKNATKTEVIVKALDEYLPVYTKFIREGGRED